MPRIAGVDIPNDKPIYVSLTYIHGLGETSAKMILAEGRIEETVRAKDLTDEELTRIASLIDKNYVVEGQLRRVVQQNVNRLKEIRCYRGLRHRQGLPVRGQNTQSNARTRKGKKKTIAGKKSVKKH